jgi:uncharacterized protein
MIIDLQELISNKDILELDEKVNIEENLLINTDIKRLDFVRVKGLIKKISNNIYNLNLTISGNMILQCAISLEDVPYDFKSEVELNLDTTKNEYNIKNINNTLDIFPILWENIVLEIPTRIVKEGVNSEIKGDGWCLTDEYKEQKIQLSQLSKLLDEGDE